MVGLRKNLKASSSRGYFRNQFRKITVNNKTNPPPDVAVNEEIFNTINAVLSMLESSSNQEVVDQENDGNSKNEDEPQEPQQLIRHFWDGLVKNDESKSPPSGQQYCNTQSKGSIGSHGASSSKPTKGNNNPQPTKVLLGFSP